MRKKAKDNFNIPDAPLNLSERGMQTERLQLCLDHILKYKGKNKLSCLEPAYFGPATFEAVKIFQEKAGIKISGNYDATTRQKLREAIDADHSI